MLTVAPGFAWTLKVTALPTALVVAATEGVFATKGGINCPSAGRFEFVPLNEPLFEFGVDAPIGRVFAPGIAGPAEGTFAGINVVVVIAGIVVVVVARLPPPPPLLPPPPDDGAAVVVGALPLVVNEKLLVVKPRESTTVADA